MASFEHCFDDKYVWPLTLYSDCSAYIFCVCLSIAIQRNPTLTAVELRVSNYHLLGILSMNSPPLEAPELTTILVSDYGCFQSRLIFLL